LSRSLIVTVVVVAVVAAMLSRLWWPSYHGRRCCGRRPCRRGRRGRCGHVVTVVAAIAVAAREGKWKWPRDKDQMVISS
jgi:hypothetical protein